MEGYEATGAWDAHVRPATDGPQLPHVLQGLQADAQEGHALDIG